MEREQSRGEDLDRWNRIAKRTHKIVVPGGGFDKIVPASSGRPKRKRQKVKRYVRTRLVFGGSRLGKNKGGPLSKNRRGAGPRRKTAQGTGARTKIGNVYLGSWEEGGVSTSGGQPGGLERIDAEKKKPRREIQSEGKHEKRADRGPGGFW